MTTEPPRSDYTLTPAFTNSVGLLLSLVLLALPPALHVVIWHRLLPEHALAVPCVIMPAIVVMLPILVLLAAAGQFLGGAPARAIRLGFRWQTFSVFLRSTQAIPLGSYRLGQFLPLVVAGVLPVLVGLLSNSPTLTLIGAVAISACSINFLVYFNSIGLPNSAFIQTVQGRPGFEVVAGIPTRQTEGL